MADGQLNLPFGQPPVQPSHAATESRRLRSWRASSAGPNSAALQGLHLVRARARDQARNNPWGASASDKLGANGIATGIQAKGLWGSKAFRAAESNLWGRWVRVCDADWVCDFYALQLLAWRELHEAGEVFVRYRSRRESDGLPVPLQIQLIEAEQVPCTLNTVASNGNMVRAGIEFDAIGRRAAYWMYREHPGDYSMAPNAHELVRVPADQVEHVYMPRRAGQIRGTPDIAPALVRLFDLDRFSGTVLERQSIANLFLGFIETPTSEFGDGEPSGPMVGPDPETGMGSGGVLGMEPGTLQEMRPGEKVTFSEPPDAGSNFSDFMRHGLMGVAATAGVPYEVLTGDLRDVSDRALRLILNEFRRLIEQKQWLTFIPRFCQPSRARYLDAAVMSGALSVSGYTELREEVAETLWVPEGWPYSHPVQDIDAEIKAMNAGLSSRSGTVLARGHDPEKVEAEIAEDNARADAHGFRFTSDSRHAKPTPAAPAAAAPQIPEGDAP